ncbi:hypothetical protein Asppvi_010946 [Aspergillus pseudoviridinutans]|uniref:Uncharacterized protein n=1 Tax=Aspergillus pseudoviridinutans TaxID=1517512 RepID=A0A9P3BQQ4_9EURO|nr:uncharacterized protein Asppvi_010946 [Aspergillus pseudoviridinutans]GIJ91971.1 hypothetical protein Asppvi_010946 [Aspergillus pseudoviridinutans]
METLRQLNKAMETLHGSVVRANQAPLEQSLNDEHLVNRESINNTTQHLHGTSSHPENAPGTEGPGPLDSSQRISTVPTTSVTAPPDRPPARDQPDTELSTHQSHEQQSSDRYLPSDHNTTTLPTTSATAPNQPPAGDQLGAETLIQQLSRLMYGNDSSGMVQSGGSAFQQATQCLSGSDASSGWTPQAAIAAVVAGIGAANAGGVINNSLAAQRNATVANDQLVLSRQIFDHTKYVDLQNINIKERELAMAQETHELEKAKRTAEIAKLNAEITIQREHTSRHLAATDELLQLLHLMLKLGWIVAPRHNPGDEDGSPGDFPGEAPDSQAQAILNNLRTTASENGNRHVPVGEASASPVGGAYEEPPVTLGPPSNHERARAPRNPRQNSPTLESTPGRESMTHVSESEEGNQLDNSTAVAA